MTCMLVELEPAFHSERNESQVAGFQMPGGGGGGVGMNLGALLARCEPHPRSLARSAMSSEPPPPPQPPTHQASVGLLDTHRARNRSPSPLRGNVVPSPLPTRRTRTYSA